MSATRPRKPFIVILAALILIVAVGIVIFSIRMVDAVKNDPQTVAGAAHVVHADTPAQAEASVTTGAKPLAPGEATQSSTNPGQRASPGR